MTPEEHCYETFRIVAAAHAANCPNCTPRRMCKYGHLVGLRAGNTAFRKAALRDADPETTRAGHE